MDKKEIKEIVSGIVVVVGVIVLALFVWPWFGGWDLLNITGRDSLRNPDDCIITQEGENERECAP